MHILILGAGALGSLLGARLAPSEARVTLFSTNMQHIRAIQNNGLEIIELDQTLSRHHLQALYRVEQIESPPDLVLVLVKSYSTLQAIQTVLPVCSQDTLFLTLQNGIGNWETIARAIPKNNILAGITAQGATYLQPGKIRHGGDGATYIGEIASPAGARIQEIVRIFQQTPLEAQATDQTIKLLWRKLLINIGINALTGILKAPNGIIADSGPARETALNAVREGCLLASQLGLELDQESMQQQVLDVARATSRNISSMHQDLLRGKPTEIEAINGALVQIAEEHNIPAPVNLTLANLVRVLEEVNKPKESSHD